MPAHGLPVAEVDTGTVSRDITGTQEVVLQEVLQGDHHDHQDRQELGGLQEALGLETVEVLQMGRQEGQGHREVWVHIEGSLLVPEVGVDEVVEDQSRCRRLRRRHRGLRQVVRNWVVEEPLREEVRS